MLLYRRQFAFAMPRKRSDADDVAKRFASAQLASWSPTLAYIVIALLITASESGRSANACRAR